MSPGKFILTHVQSRIDSRRNLTLTLESSGPFDEAALVDLLGTFVTIVPYTEDES